MSRDCSPRIVDKGVGVSRFWKGKGATAVDISSFFYRSKQHIAFEKFWVSSSTRRERGAAD